MLTIELIKEAAARIHGSVHRTPVITSRSFNEATGKEVFFKCENLQRAGAFKIRGATNKIRSLTEEERKRGVAAFSSGNHAQAVALASREAGIRAVIAMPEDAPKAKVAATQAYGAEIVFYDRLKQDREEVAIEIAERDGRVMVPPYDDYLILAGQSTCGLELVEEVPDLDCLLAPCSGGGLFAGVSTAAKAMNPRIRCFAVEPDTADDTRQSFLKGERVTIPPPPTIADGLRVVARREGCHAAFLLFFSQRKNLVGGAANLEGAGALQVFTLEENFFARQLIEVTGSNNRCAVNAAAQSHGRAFDEFD